MQFVPWPPECYEWIRHASAFSTPGKLRSICPEFGRGVRNKDLPTLAGKLSMSRSVSSIRWMFTISQFCVAMFMYGRRAVAST